MRTKAIVTALLLSLLAAVPSRADEAAWTVTGRALLVTTQTTSSTSIPPAFLPYTETWITQRVVLPGGQFLDFDVICPANLAPWYCTPWAFLGTCNKTVQTYIGDGDGSVTSGSVTFCTQFNAGNCTKTSGGFDQQQSEVLELKEKASNCQW